MRNGKSQQIGIALAAAILCALFTWALGNTQWGERADLFFQDRLLRLRHQQGKGPRANEQILIVAIDEKSRREVKPKPIALWLPHFATVLQTAFESGAQLVAFDIISTHDDRELLLPLAMAAGQYQSKTVLACFFDKEENELIKPVEQLTLSFGVDRLGLSNLMRDPDLIFRRQPLQNYQVKDEVLPFFTSLIYETVKPDGKLPEELVVNFAGPPGTFNRVSFSDILDLSANGESEKLKQLFENKIVLIGGTAKADLDFVETPFPSDKPMPGVEMHANILNTLLADNGLKDRQLYGLLVLLLIPVAWASLELPLKKSLPLTIGACFVWLASLYPQFLGGHLVTPALTAIPGILGSSFLGYLYRFNTVEKERRRIRSVFGRYVSKDVMEEMLRVPQDHKPEHATRRRVTVMFSDINDFSTACEQLEPEEVTRRLNLYFGEMTNIIYEHQGTIIRFIGDEFMVLFGAPKENKNSEELAVLAGVKMVERLNQLREKDPEEKNGFYHVKLGIHVGDMILTSIGNELRSDYNCIGDSTNMAARVLSLTKPLDATVLISQDVKDKVANHPKLSFLDKGTHPVKGRAGEVHVYDVSLK